MTEPLIHAALEAATTQMSDMTVDLAAVTMTKTMSVIVATTAMTLATPLSLNGSAREIETCLLLGLAELMS
jgi:hypothetical protein